MKIQIPSLGTLCLATLMVSGIGATVQGEDPITIGNRLELFTDDYLIDDIQGDIVQLVQQPEPKEVVLIADQPWEGNTSGYFTIMQDGDIYRMVYRGWEHDENVKALHEEATCYAESQDGIHWTKPDLGLYEWNGSKKNNIIWLGNPAHNFTPFQDDSPLSTPETRFKAVGGLGGVGLKAFISSDSQHWKLLQEKSILKQGVFDSQNVVFWDEDNEEYRAYWRYTSKNPSVRAIRTATSKDFVSWKDVKNLTYTDGPLKEHLYTNAVQKYFRAPHMFIGFPTRFDPKTFQVEPVFMSSRNGLHFHRYADAVIPLTAPEDRNFNRSNYMALGMVQLPDSPDEISVYATENYLQETPGRLRRFVYRLDGFVALHGGEAGGQLTTKPLSYTGQQLLLNSVVPQDGSLEVEVLDQSGKVVGVSNPITGDSIDAPVSWKTDPKLSEGVVQLRFKIKNADVFSFRFN